MLPPKIRKAPKGDGKWRSPSHRKFVRTFACCCCGSETNVVAAHVRMGSNAGAGSKPDDWRTVPLCDGPFSNKDGQLGCHDRQHIIGEDTFWQQYVGAKQQTVWQLIEAFCKASPKAAEIRRVREEREAA